MCENLIVIALDYSDDQNLLSYEEVLENVKKNKPLIVTNCLNFFDFGLLDLGYDVKVKKKNGQYILMSELLLNDGTYTNKNIRKAHNISKMLIAGSFSFKK